MSNPLLRFGSFVRGGTTDSTGHELHLTGGREADVFYRDRWAYDKVVRSTHGVNCTGSCSWKVYVKDGVITWESQQTDYPTTGPNMPEYEPRGCPWRGVQLVHLFSYANSLSVCPRRARGNVQGKQEAAGGSSPRLA